MVSAGFTAADDGKNDASTTNRLSTSCARQKLSSTDVRSPQVAHTNDWLVLWNATGVTLLRSSDSAMFRAKFSDASMGGVRTYGATTDGRYLVAIELPSLAVRRYAFP